MTTKETISKILSSNNYAELFEDLTQWQDTYKKFVKLIHPDICKEKGAVEASMKLGQFKTEIEKGLKHIDDAGTITYFFDHCVIKGDADLIKLSVNNYNYLMKLKDPASINFHKYLPESLKVVSGTEIIFNFKQRCVPLSVIGTMEHKHVNWVLSRMLELTGWFNQIGYSHAGLNPDSIYCVPETHGIICISFYHMAKLGTKLKTVSGKYQNLYPSQVFTKKIADPNIDIDLCKKTAIYLLGDKSGSGTKLRKTTLPEDVINYLQKQQSIPLEAYEQHRKLLKKHFDTKIFHNLAV